MKLWSKGLGTKTLVLNLGEGVPSATPESFLIRGTIKEPVWWDYTITMTEKDLIDILKVAVNQEAIAYLQTVERPWKVVGTLAVAMSRFLVLWIMARLGVYWRRLWEKKVAEGGMT